MSASLWLGACPFFQVNEFKIPNPFFGIKKTFPTEFSLSAPLTDSVDPESLEETEKLRGKKWHEVESLLQESFEMPYWMSPIAYHYFFPAYILASQNNLEKSELALQYAIRVLGKRDDEDGATLLFTEDQWQLIARWLNWLEQKVSTDPGLLAAIFDAKEVVENRGNKEEKGDRHGAG